jgi:hypothetical protein
MEKVGLKCFEQSEIYNGLVKAKTKRSELESIK